MAGYQPAPVVAQVTGSVSCVGVNQVRLGRSFGSCFTPVELISCGGLSKERL